MSCAIFQSFEHLVEECPILPAAREMFGIIQISFGNHNHVSTCNPLKPPHQALKLEQAIVNLTKVVEDFVAHQKSIIDQFRQKNAQVRQEINSQDRKMDERLNDLSQKTDNLEYSRSRLINLNTEREKENFPSQPYQHLKGIHKGEAQKKENSMVRKVKVVMVDQPTFKPKHDEGLPEPSEKLANLFHWTRTKEMQPLLNAVEIQRHAKESPQSLFLTRYLQR
ncbi:hypothetical protein CK203_029588 [Vitis vinifera]|uniref:Uncharacterized protein n=1 Tax=Vitis vinifera TaxID=29760 RepID=A0A438JCL2_VITVI|nr:hypothetical protein CK203_029588 [Vitis vinifera]